MILVYCNHITNRHRYIFSFIFEDILGMKLHLTGDSNEFLTADGPKLKYSEEEIPGIPHIRPQGLLEETGIRRQDELVEQWNSETVDHWNSGQVVGWSGGQGDPFALAFYLVTRYEEYLPFEADEHGRFRAESSLAFQKGFLKVPLVDAMAHELKKMLTDRYPGLEIPGQPYRFIPSFDIDIAFAHLAKGWGRASAAWLKLLLKADIKQIKERVATLAGKIEDPYDNFHLHKEITENYNLSRLYFVLTGDFSKYDRNNSYKSLRFRNLINELSLTAELGLHPSYRSHLHPDLFEEEKRRLGNMVNKPIAKSRFHFLRLKFPESYRLLISNGITDDYSLGYSTMNGFRASTCTPFLFYDIEREDVTSLRLHPFIFMDSAIIDHLKLKPEQAVTEISGLMDHVKLYGGEAIGTWHNYSLCEKDQYKGWQAVLRSIIEEYH
jgi:hypothetical protein